MSFMRSKVTNRGIKFIPKGNNLMNFNQFKIISLLNVSYKILTNILSKWISYLFPSLISKNQGGVVKGRWIKKNVILVQEAILSIIITHEEAMILKNSMGNDFVRDIFNLLWWN